MPRAARSSGSGSCWRRRATPASRTLPIGILPREEAPLADRLRRIGDAGDLVEATCAIPPGCSRRPRGDRRAIDGIANTLSSGTEAELSLKKAFEPISILVVGIGGFVLGSIASGFVGKVGSDAYDGLKHRLVDLYSGRHRGQGLWTSASASLTTATTRYMSWSSDPVLKAHPACSKRGSQDWTTWSELLMASSTTTSVSLMPSGSGGACGQAWRYAA